MARLDPDVKEAVEGALRAIQMYDEVAPALPARALLIEAETKLGEVLGLECSGEDEGGGFYDHSGGTCPVHEWVRAEDQPVAHARYGAGERPS